MPEPIPSKKPDTEETLQFLKREEVRTMAKDIARLHEQEAIKERERIVQLHDIPQSGTKIESQAALPPLMPHAKDLPAGRQGQKPALVRAKARSEKILIRVIVIGVLLFILLNGLAFGYWYFTKKRVAEIAPSPQPSPPILEEPITPSPAPAPLVFFNAAQEKTLELDATDNLITLLSEVLKEEYKQGFTRILVKKTEDAAFLTAREFTNKAGLGMPESLLSLLKEDFMLFVYSSPARKRLGFIGELSQGEGVQDMVRVWETTMEQDTKALWEIVGQKGSAYTPFFRQSVYENNPVRFQTFSVIDFGVVYTLVGTKLILATSFESVTKAVDLLIQSR